MPGHDQTGPRGEGARTGGGFGRCNGNATNDTDTNDDRLYGLGKGGGNRRGNGAGTRGGGNRGGNGAGSGGGRGRGRR